MAGGPRKLGLEELDGVTGGSAARFSGHEEVAWGGSYQGEASDDTLSVHVDGMGQELSFDGGAGQDLLELVTDWPEGLVVYLDGVPGPLQPQHGPDGSLSWTIPSSASGFVMMPDGNEVAFSNVERIQAAPR